MTIADCLAQVDELKPNTYDDAMKIRWLSELDGKIFYDLVKTHVREKIKPIKNESIITPSDDNEEELETEELDEGTEETNEEEELIDPPDFFGYTDEDLTVELIAPFPYDSIYRNYIFALIDYANGEADRYQATMSMFNSQYQDFCNWYNRTHETIKSPLKVF